MRKEALDRIFNYEEGRGLAFRFRQKRGAIFRDFVETHFADRPSLKIIDLGGTEEFWISVGYDYLRSRNISIDLLNLFPIEVQNTDLFSAVEGDACTFSPEQRYDICFSNSVIEHVGETRRILEFRDTVCRIADSYFIQTPNFYFPIEPHFVFPCFHWLPKVVQVGLNRRFTLGHMTKSANLLDAYLTVESCNILRPNVFKALFPEATIVRERLFGLCKSMIALKAS
ncbi:hypothetical protein [Roseibium sp.]|uniref:hypothetical protein n=1 Tax=Roseibium sp. TaxID=1936156 RepID=UPI003A977F27